MKGDDRVALRALHWYRALIGRNLLFSTELQRRHCAGK